MSLISRERVHDMREMRASLKGCREHPESILRGYGPVCYKKIMPPRPKKTRAAKGDCSPVDDWDYEVPGQMELSDFIEMPKGGNDDD